MACVGSKVLGAGHGHLEAECHVATADPSLSRLRRGLELVATRLVKTCAPLRRRCGWVLEQMRSRPSCNRERPTGDAANHARRRAPTKSPSHAHTHRSIVLAGSRNMAMHLCARSVRQQDGQQRGSIDRLMMVWGCFLSRSCRRPKARARVRRTSDNSSLLPPKRQTPSTASHAGPPGRAGRLCPPPRARRPSRGRGRPRAPQPLARGGARPGLPVRSAPLPLLSLAGTLLVPFWAS